MFLTDSQARARAASSPFRMPQERPVEPPIAAEVPIQGDTTTPINNASLVILDEAPGRPAGSENLDIETRSLIGAIANLPGSQRELAENLGISEQRVSNYKHGKINGKDSPELKSALNSKKEKIADTALEKLSASLGLISDEKLSGTSAKNLSGIAKDMSAVVKNLSGNDNAQQQNIFFIHSPISSDGKGFHKEEFYETIEVGS